MALITVQRSPHIDPDTQNPAETSPQPQDAPFSRARLKKRDSFLMSQGSALLFPSPQTDVKVLANQRPATMKVGTLQQHLEAMCDLLRQEDTIILAVRLECSKPQRFRYLLMVSNAERLDVGENIILGVDLKDTAGKLSCTIGLVLPIWSDTQVFLDGDGGFSITSASRTCLFKPISVQVMWTVLQALHKACEEASQCNHYPGGSGLQWSTYYTERINSNQKCINDWNAMADLLSVRPESPGAVSTATERDLIERRIRTGLRTIMVDMDLDKATSRDIRTALELHLNQDLKQYKGFVDNELLLVLAQMDKPSKIFDFLYLGSEWNASNLEELEQNGVGYILNVTREIDNFFPARFEYLNIRVYDEESTDLLSQWEQSYRFITTARFSQSRCLVHCKMGVSRSASTVMAFAMKEFGWDLEQAYAYVKERRKVVKPNAGFLNQLRIYQGILNASKQRHNYLWRSLSETDLTEISEEKPQEETRLRSQDDSETGTRLHSPKPHSPSLSPLRPHSPSLSPRRPHSPSLSPCRPHSPSDSPLRPHSPSDSPRRPHSPSDSPRRPHSPSDTPPRPHSPSSSFHPRPDSPSCSPHDQAVTKDYPAGVLRGPLASQARPAARLLPSMSLRETSGREWDLTGGRQQEGGPWVPQPLTPSLREKIDLLTLMGQVKEMERLQEVPDSLSPLGTQRGQAWRRRAFSVQIDSESWSKVHTEQPGERGGAGPRSPGAQPRRNPRDPRSSLPPLCHSAAIDLTEEEEEEDPLEEGEGSLAQVGGDRGRGAVRGGRVKPERAPFKHSDSLAALQRAALVTHWKEGFGGSEGVSEEGEEGTEDTPSP